MKKDNSKGTIKNGVKVAAMVTTLGISLGVNIDQLQAQDISKDQVNRTPATESSQYKLDNTQIKVESNQIKVEDTQLKVKNTQIKVENNLTK